VSLAVIAYNSTSFSKLPRGCISAALTGVGKFPGGAGNAVAIMVRIAALFDGLHGF
jgi:hypothetical protein